MADKSGIEWTADDEGDDPNGPCACGCLGPDDPDWWDVGGPVEGVSQHYCSCACHGGGSFED